jgi:hypothetical protein
MIVVIIINDLYHSKSNRLLNGRGIALVVFSAYCPLSFLICKVIQLNYINVRLQ